MIEDWADLLVALADLRISRDDLSRQGPVIQLGLPPNRIDLLTSLIGELPPSPG